MSDRVVRAGGEVVRVIRTFLLKTTSTIDENNPSDACIVRLSDDDAQTLLRRRTAFQMLDAYDRKLRQIEFWDYAPDFVTGGGADLWDETMETAPAGAESRVYFVVCGDIKGVSVPVDRSLARVVVTEEGVYWSAPDKDDRFVLSTGDLPWGEIERLAKKEVPLPFET